MSCSNWMMFDEIRNTVKEYNKRNLTEDSEDDLSYFNITKNCSECNMRPHFSDKIEIVFQALNLFKDPIMTELEAHGMKRKCFKE